jgi:hypothetical protein
VLGFVPCGFRWVFFWVDVGCSFRDLGFRSSWVLLGSFLWVGSGCSCVYSLCT